MFPFGFRFNCKSSNVCFSSEPGQICKIWICQGVKLNKTRFGFTRGAAGKKRAINNASQNPKPTGLVWEVGRSLGMLGTRRNAILSNTSFSRNPASAGNSQKLGKINKTDRPKIFKREIVPAICCIVMPLFRGQKYLAE